MMRNVFTWAGVHSSHRITGISAMLSLRAALRRRWPSTTSPSLRASNWILKTELPNATAHAPGRARRGRADEEGDPREEDAQAPKGREERGERRAARRQ